MSIPRDVIGVDAAEGGLEDLQVTLDVRWFHQWLASGSTLPLGFANDDQTLRQRHVHRAPPGTNLVAQPSSSIGLELIGPNRAQHGVIDRLLVAAAVWGCRVIAVLRSGCDGGGTRGLMAVKQADGIGIVQDVGVAQAPDLPAHAIAAGKPHDVASVDVLVNFAERADPGPVSVAP